MIPFARPLIGDQERQAVANVLSGHVLTHGPHCRIFEERFAEYLGVRHAITTSSCTTALHLALVTLGIGPGDEVIVPAETHVATGHVVEHCGARPVFVDAERETGNIAVAAIEAAITPATRAVMVVHYLGLSCRMDEICALAAAHDLPVVEDCAISLGAMHGAKMTGGFGIAGCFSFYPSKHITTMEGGMLVTNDDSFAALVRQKRAFGYDRGADERKVPGIYDVTMLGYNYRMSEAQAAIGVVQLGRIDEFIRQRIRNSDIIQGTLQQVDGVTVLPFEDGRSTSTRYCVNAILAPEIGHLRDDLIVRINQAGVGTSVHYPVALPHSAYYASKYAVAADAFPVASWLSTCSISLPCGAHMSDEDARTVAKTFVQQLTALEDNRGR